MGHNDFGLQIEGIKEPLQTKGSSWIYYTCNILCNYCVYL